MTDKKITIELSEEDAKLFALFEKYYLQFKKIIDQDVFDKDFTAKVVLDVHYGVIRNLQKILNYRFDIRI